LRLAFGDWLRLLLLWRRENSASPRKSAALGGCCEHRGKEGGWYQRAYSNCPCQIPVGGVWLLVKSANGFKIWDNNGLVLLTQRSPSAALKERQSGLLSKFTQTCLHQIPPISTKHNAQTKHKHKALDSIHSGLRSLDRAIAPC
jgi:hypothetical protein